MNLHTDADYRDLCKSPSGRKRAILEKEFNELRKLYNGRSTVTETDITNLLDRIRLLLQPAWFMCCDGLDPLVKNTKIAKWCLHDLATSRNSGNLLTKFPLCHVRTCSTKSQISFRK